MAHTPILHRRRPRLLTLRTLMAGAIAATTLSIGPGEVAASTDTATAPADQCLHLTFAGTDHLPGRKEVFVADGTTGARLLLPTLDIENPGEPHLVGEGDRLVLVGSRDNRRQILTGLVGSTEFTSVSGLDAGAPIANQGLTVSLDGTTVAWVGTGAASDGTFHAGQVWVADIDGSNRRNVSDGESTLATRPTLSPDGRYAAWTAEVRPEGAVTSDLRAIVADLRTGRRITLEAEEHPFVSASNRAVAISPDGRSVAWTASDRENDTLAVSDLATGTTHRPIGHDRLRPTTVQWAPHGREVLAHDRQPFIVSTMDGPTEDMRSATDADLVRSSPAMAWAAHDTLVAYVPQSDETPIEVTRSDVSRPSEAGFGLPGTGGTATTPTHLTWSVDGRIAWIDRNSGAEARVLRVGESEIFSASASTTVQRPGEPAPRSEDPDDVAGLRWSHALTTIEGSVNRVGEQLQVTARNTGACPATVWVGIDERCIPGIEERVQPYARLATLGPDEAASATIALQPNCSVETAALVGRNFVASHFDLEADEPGNPGAACAGNTIVPFSDVTGSFAEADIACIFELGITTGTSATTYSPDNNVTREQMAAFLARTWTALGNTCPTTEPPFTDVTGSFAETDIACIFELGITTGTSATTYSPDNHVTREQMAAFLARLIRVAG